MKHFSIKPAVVALFAVTSLFAAEALVDDHEDGTDQNEFEQYWYYYDDNSGVNENDRPQAAPTSTPSIINVPYTERPREAFGNPDDTWKFKVYTFCIGEEAGNKFASMPFTYGDEWRASYGMASPYVGMGTSLAEDGKSIDLTGAESVSFKIRSRVQELTVVFKVETFDIDQDSSFTHYQKSITVGTEWTPVTIGLTTDDLAQPSWTPASAERPFALNKVIKLAWEVPGTVNDITGDTLQVDDIVISPFSYVSPKVKLNDPVATPENPETIFSTFEGTFKDATPVNTYWFAYNDAQIGGTSTVRAGAITNPETNLLNLAFEPGSGSDGVGHAPFIEFTLGKTIEQPSAANPAKTEKIQGFVGIGVTLYDSATSSYYDAANGKRGALGSGNAADGIYFEYLADGDFKYVTLEVSDMHDVGDATEPARKYSRGSGIVWYRCFEKTGLGVWRSGRIRFSELVVNSSWEGYVDIPLDISKLAKIQFKVQGAEGNSGALYIDNVDFTAPVSVIRHSTRAGGSSGFAAHYNNGVLMVNWNSNRVVRGNVALLNTKGAVVYTAPVAGKTLTQQIAATAFPAGLYFVQFSGADDAGKKIVRRSVVSIVK